MHTMKGLSQVRRKMELLLKGKGRVLVTSETSFQEIMSVLIVELDVACFQCLSLRYPYRPSFSSSTSQHKLHSELMMISSEALQAGDLSKERPEASQNKFQTKIYTGAKATAVSALAHLGSGLVASL